jgi:hypothetical protein
MWHWKGGDKEYHSRTLTSQVTKAKQNWMHSNSLQHVFLFQQQQQGIKKHLHTETCGIL